MTNPLRLRLIPYNARLLDARKERGLTQKNLAMLTGLNENYLRQIETLRVVPGHRAMDEICSALELSEDYLFPSSLMEAVKEGLFENRLAELEEKQIIRLTEGRRAGLLPSPAAEDPALKAIEGNLDDGSLRGIILSVLETLPPREREVLELRFGLKDGRSRTLNEVAQYFTSRQTGYAVTQERIRQIEAKALRLMRHPRRSRLLKDYLD